MSMLVISLERMNKAKYRYYLGRRKKGKLEKTGKKKGEVKQNTNNVKKTERGEKEERDICSLLCDWPCLRRMRRAKKRKQKRGKKRKEKGKEKKRKE